MKTLRDRVVDALDEFGDGPVGPDTMLGIFHDYLLDVSAEFRANEELKVLGGAIATIVEGMASDIFPKEPRKISEANTFFGPDTPGIFTQGASVKNGNTCNQEYVYAGVDAEVTHCILPRNHDTSFHRNTDEYEWPVK